MKTIVEDVDDNVALPSATNNEKKKESKWKVVQSANHQIAPPRLLLPSQIKINQILDELKKFSIEEIHPSKTVHSITGNSPQEYFQFVHQRLKSFLLHARFHYLIIFLVLIDLIVVLIDLVLGKCKLAVPFLSLACYSTGVLYGIESSLTDDRETNYPDEQQNSLCISYVHSKQTGRHFLTVTSDTALTFSQRVI